MKSVKMRAIIALKPITLISNSTNGDITCMVISEGTSVEYALASMELSCKEEHAYEYICLEIIPFQNKWWLKPSFWIINFPLNIPLWFELNRAECIRKVFIEMNDWYYNHVHLNKTLDIVNYSYSSTHYFKDCTINTIKGNTRILIDNCKVSCIKEDVECLGIYGKSEILVVAGKVEIEKLGDYSVIKLIKDKAYVENLSDYSCIEELSGEAYIGGISDFSQVLIDTTI